MTRRGGGALERALVSALATAIALGVNSAGGESAVDVLVLCNTAHVVFPALLPALEQDFPEVAVRARIWSLIDGVVDAARWMGVARPLCSRPARRADARLFASPLERAGL